MIAVLSPAKSLDFETPPQTERYSTGDFLDHADRLVARMRDFDPSGLEDLMGISEKLATLNVDRFASYEPPVAPDNDAKQAVLAFTGDTYVGFDAASLSDDDLAYAQDHVRILSGLYGLLRPLDLIRPYRLEMGTRLDNERGANLYEFWGSQLADGMNEALGASGSRVLVNCASQEYFKALPHAAIDGRVLTPVFKDERKGKYKVISFFAKKARGAMAAYIVRHRVDDPDALKEFAWDGYAYNESMSEGDEWVFTRREA